MSRSEYTVLRILKNCVNFNGSWWKLPFQANYDHFCTKRSCFLWKSLNIQNFAKIWWIPKLCLQYMEFFMHFPIHRSYEPCLAQSTLYCGFWRIVFISMGIGENHHFRPIMTIFAQNGHVFLEKVWISKNFTKIWWTLKSCLQYWVFDAFSYTQEYEPCLAQSTLYCGFWRIVFIQWELMKITISGQLWPFLHKTVMFSLKKFEYPNNSPKFDEP